MDHAAVQPFAPSGLAATPVLQWGSHLGHLFDAADELHDVLAPYFKAGLENNERCLWVIGAPSTEAGARAALRAILPDLDEREQRGDIEILDGSAFYDTSQPLPIGDLFAGLLQREADALAAGFAGLRTNGNCAWVGDGEWADFQRYEALVQGGVRGRRMICMCSYHPEKLQAGQMVEVLDRHDLVVSRQRDGNRSGVPESPVSEAISPSASDLPSEMRQLLERQQRTFDLAMVASQMGTWRYTLSDNVCIYDENAQRLYGLTEARFLHDEAGVAAKFHPDDMDLMWSRVAKALDPTGDGHYDVEYRVKQLDGSWRWLSAWGTVEFEDQGGVRTPVAISGASRDLSESKKAEELQQLLINELNHRMKNTLATVQSIVTYSLRGAIDLQAGRSSLNERIVSLARVHDLLTVRSWTGADLTDVVHRAMEPFSQAQLDLSGPSVDLSPRHALALSLALHELATNAAKYGALSVSEGRVQVRWNQVAQRVRLSWRESGGPRVTLPTRRGFGSRLLEDSLARDLGEGCKLEYAPEGVRCELQVVL